MCVSFTFIIFISLRRFTSSHCREGALGIDLSFATHLFLMDSILDAELEQQVVSRVYRMGCVQAVRVHQLYMQDSLEEDIMM